MDVILCCPKWMKRSIKILYSFSFFLCLKLYSLLFSRANTCSGIKGVLLMYHLYLSSSCVCLTLSSVFLFSLIIKTGNLDLLILSWYDPHALSGFAAVLLMLPISTVHIWGQYSSWGCIIDLYFGIISFSSTILDLIVQHFVVSFDYLCTLSWYFYYAVWSNGNSFLEWLQLNWESEMCITTSHYSFYYAFIDTEFHLQLATLSTRFWYFIILSA